MSEQKRRARERAFRATKGRCEYCGAQTSFEEGTVDHWKPKSLGGSLARRNLRWACRPCNQKKANATPWEWITQRASA